MDRLLLLPHREDACHRGLAWDELDPLRRRGDLGELDAHALQLHHGGEAPLVGLLERTAARQAGPEGPVGRSRIGDLTEARGRGSNLQHFAVQPPHPLLPRPYAHAVQHPVQQVVGGCEPDRLVVHALDESVQRLVVAPRQAVFDPERLLVQRGRVVRGGELHLKLGILRVDVLVVAVGEVGVDGEGFIGQAVVEVHTGLAEPAHAQLMREVPRKVGRADGVLVHPLGELGAELHECEGEATLHSCAVEVVDGEGPGSTHEGVRPSVAVVEAEPGVHPPEDLPWTPLLVLPWIGRHVEQVRDGLYCTHVIRPLGQAAPKHR